jgi:hypothetical protein
MNGKYGRSGTQQYWGPNVASWVSDADVACYAAEQQTTSPRPRAFACTLDKHKRRTSATCSQPPRRGGLLINSDMMLEATIFRP